MAKFKLMWENTPDTPIDAAALSEVTNSASEIGGILYKDISQLIPNGDYSDDFLKIRANSRVLLKTYETRAMFFNTPGTLVSHNGEFGPISQDNVAFLNDSLNNTNSVYAGLGTTNILSNPGFEDGFAPDWNVSIEDNPQNPGYVDPVYGEEYKAVVEISDDGFKSSKSARMYNGAFGRTEISRSVDLTGKPVVSISFYYKSNGGLRFYITSGSLYWKDNDWNPSTSAFYELQAASDWTRFEIKNIITQKISTTAEDVGIYIYSDIAGAEHFIDNVQLEELAFVSPYVEDVRADSLLRYPAEVIRADKGYVDMTIYPKDMRDFTLFAISTVLPENAVDLTYNKTFDKFQLRVWDTNTSSYLTLDIAAHLSERIDSWTRIICGWDKDYGLKIITTSSPNIEHEATPFTPHLHERLRSFDVASSRATNFGNFFIDNIKINVELKEDAAIIKDFEKVYTTVDNDTYRVFHVGEETIVIDPSYLDVGKAYDVHTNYYLWIVDNLSEDDGTIYVSKSTERPYGLTELQTATIFGGFRTDNNAIPMASSVWDITEKDDRIYTKRLMVDGTDSNDYNFDIRTQDYAETNDVRSTIPVHFSDNLYGRHMNDSIIHPETGTHEVQYFEVNTEGWMAIDNIHFDGNKITTRNYPDSIGVFNNNLELTTYGEPSKIWIHSHEIDIDSGNRDIKLDLLRIDENILYTKTFTDLRVDVSHTDDPTNRNDIYLIGHDIFLQPTNDLQFDINADFVVNAGRHFIVNTGSNFLFDAGADFRLTTGGQIELDDININNYHVFNDTGDIHLYSSATIDIDSGSGQIELDNIHIKNNLIHRDAGDIIIETPNDIIIGKAGTGTNPYTSTVSIRSDRFVVESQAVEFTNVDASDFIRFDSIKIKQSKLYTDATTPMSISSAGTLTQHSDANIYLNTNNNIEFQETGGNFISRVKSTFTKDLHVLNVQFTDVDYTDTASIFTQNTGGTSTFHIQVSDDSNDKIIIEHKGVGQSTGNGMVQIGRDDVIINGNLIVQGDQTILNTTNTSVQDSTFTIKTSNPAMNGNASYEVQRVSGNAKLIWNDAVDLWQVDNGDNIVHNVIFNGYDERFSENVNIVTTEPAGFKLENSMAVGGMELLNPNTYNLNSGEAIMNIGLHMGYNGGYINDKLLPDGVTYNAASVGAFIKIDTRSTQKKMGFIWEHANTNNEIEVVSLNMNNESVAQQLSTYANKGFFKAPWIRTHALEVINEGGTASTGIFMGSAAATSAGYRLSQDEIVISTYGANRIKINNDIELNANSIELNANSIKLNAVTKIDGSGNFYANTSAPTGSTRLNYDGYFYATRVYNAVYNDLAEYFLAEDEVKPGKVYTFNKDGKLILSLKRADKNVAGVCSDTPAFVMKQEYEEQGGIPLALAGSVDVWVHGLINVGDELVSDKDGFACKARWYDKLFNRSTIIGKALKRNPGGKGRILMLVKNV